jgi:release factor glutamine methyltransferase
MGVTDGLIVEGPKRIVIRTDRDVYEPADDTELLLRSVHLRAGERVLEVGTGTGIVAIHCARLGGRVTATDIQASAVELARQNADANGIELELLEGDMFDPVRGTYDVVILNPPYLPTAPEDLTNTPLDGALDGGPDGTRVALRFIGGLRAHMTDGGRAYMVVSSLQDVDRLRMAIAEQGLAHRTVGSSRFDFETISVLEIRHPHKRTAGRRVPTPDRRLR